MKILPGKVFFTKGIGVHKERLRSFECALRDAGIEKYNLVYVSSILPPYCEAVSKEEGLKLLSPGEIAFCVMARNECNEARRMVSSAIGLAVPEDCSEYGYLSEAHEYGMTDTEVGDYAEDLAAAMLASTLGIDLDPEAAWDERRQQYLSSGKIIDTSSTSVSTVCAPGGLWTTTVAAAVFIV